MTKIVFLTLFLGLTMDRHPVSLNVTGPVARVEVTLDGKQVAVLTQPPWNTSVDFGLRLTPRRLVARALDTNGVELARVEQRINVPRMQTEVTLVLEDGTARLVWQSLDSEKPKRVQWTLDGKQLRTTALQITLPPLDLQRPHVLRAVGTSENGQIADAELVFGGGLNDTSGTALTALPLRVTRDADVAAAAITVNGEAANVTAVERLTGDIFIVRNPSLAALAFRLDFENRGRRRSGFDDFQGNIGVPVQRRTRTRFIWPIATRAQGTSVAYLFPTSRAFAVADGAAVRGVMANVSAPLRGPLRYADAVAVAGLQAAASRHPRAVVVVLEDNHQDSSQLTPQQAREYLASIGVPLYVWTLSETPPPEWGEARLVDGLDGIRDAAADLLADIQRQRIVWIAGDYLLAEVAVSGNATPLWSVR